MGNNVEIIILGEENQRTAAPFDNGHNRSIHPRNWSKVNFEPVYGVNREREKKNTMKKKNPRTIARVLSALREHFRSHPHDRQTARRIEVISRMYE